MTVFSKAKHLLVKSVKETISNRVSYDAEKRAVLIRHDIVAMSARRAINKAEEIQEVNVEVGEGRYVVKLRTSSGVGASIPMIPEKLALEKDRVRVSVQLPDGVQIRHENAVLSYLVRFMNKIFNIADSKMGEMHDIDYDGRKNLTYARRIEDFPLARVYRRYVGEGKVLPIEFRPEYLALDLSAMFPRGESPDVKKLVVPPSSDR